MLDFSVHEVRQLVQLPDGGVVFAGEFHRVNLAPSNGIARLDRDGVPVPAWNPVVTGNSPYGEVIAYGASGSVYLATVTPNTIVRISLATGVTDAAWKIDLGSTEYPRSLLVDETADELYVGLDDGIRKYRLSTRVPLPEFAVRLASGGY